MIIIFDTEIIEIKTLHMSKKSCTYSVRFIGIVQELINQLEHLKLTKLINVRTLSSLPMSIVYVIYQTR